MNFQSLCYRPDVVFEGRNKAYGAYIMRKLYEKRILTSVALAILFFAVAMISPVLINTLAAKEADDKIVIKAVVAKLPPPPKEETPPPPVLSTPTPPPVQRETVKFLPFEPKNDNEVKDEAPQKEDLQGKQSAPESNPGNTDEFQPKEEEFKKDLPKEVEVTKPETIYLVVQKNAEFPGGAKGMQKFMDRNYKQPKELQRINITGKVFVKFAVMKDGSIDQIQISRGIANCPACDAEAIRLVKAMPKWTPAQQNGNNVSVWFTLPISFKMNDEK